MPSNANSGTQTATVTTEHTLATVTAAGNYLLKVDTKNMVKGDQLTLKVKDKVLTGSTSALVFSGTYRNVQEDIIKVSIPISLVFEAVFTLTQDAGTSRTFEWAVVDMS